MINSTEYFSTKKSYMDSRLMYKLAEGKINALLQIKKYQNLPLMSPKKDFDKWQHFIDKSLEYGYGILEFMKKSEEHHIYGMALFQIIDDFYSSESRGN